MISRRLSSIGWVAAAALLIGASAPRRHIAFVACPIVRDTKTVPCWLAEHGGELFYLGIQTDVSAEFNWPSLGHRVLVEGEPSDDPRICGGVVMKSVKVSVMEARADDCNTLLPAEDRYDLPFEAPRPPGPSGGRLAFSYPAPPPAPKAPFRPKSFSIPYAFDGMVGFQHPRFLAPVAAYAREIGARHISITGFRGATRLDDGKLLIEDREIGRKRAEQIADLLRGVGVTAPTYEVVGRTQYEVGDWKMRRVTVVVSP